MSVAVGGSMEHHIFAPVLKTQSSDPQAFFAYSNIFYSAPAMALKICAIARRYSNDQGVITVDGPPLPLQLGADGQTVTELNPYTPLADKSMERQAKKLRSEFHRIRLPKHLVIDFKSVSQDRAWVIAFPGAVIMQADDIEAEISRVSDRSTLDQSTQARSAFASIRAPSVQSNHALLKAQDKIERALHILRIFRSEAIDAAKDAGLHMGDIDHACARNLLEK